MLSAPFSNSPWREREPRTAAMLRNCVSRIAMRTPPRSRRDKFLVSHFSFLLAFRLPPRYYFTARMPRIIARRQTDQPVVGIPLRPLSALPSTHSTRRSLSNFYAHPPSWPTATRKNGVSLVTQSNKHAPFHLHFLRQAAPRPRSR